MGSGEETRLRAELQYYETHKEDWLRTHRDDFVVVRDAELLGFFSDFPSAYQAGAEKYGIDSDFLVKRVTAHEPVFVVF
jgi:hypothetical protein